MTPDPPLTPPTPPASEPPEGADRDQTVSSWLAVEPLDEVTRARLVRTALAATAAGTAAEPDADSAPGGHRVARLLAVAAALLAVLAVSLAVLLPRDDDTAPTALDRTEAGAEAERPGGVGNGSETFSVPAAPDTEAPTAAADQATETLALPDLGALGDVSTSSRLRDAVAATATRDRSGTGTTAVSGCALAAARALGTPTAAGTGTLDGRPATVLAVRRPDGASAAVATRGPSCGRVVSVVLT
jgi:hypothetical protein